MKVITKYLFLFFVICIVAANIYFKHLESSLTNEQIADYESYVSSSKVIIMEDSSIFTPKKVVSMNYSEAKDVSRLLMINYFILLLSIICVLSKELKSKGYIAFFPVKDTHLFIYSMLILLPILMFLYEVLHVLLYRLILFSYFTLAGGGALHYIEGVDPFYAITTIIILIITIFSIYKIKRSKKEIKIGRVGWSILLFVLFLGSVLFYAQVIVEAMLGGH